MFRTLLVPIDFSPPSLQAARHAGELVRAVGGWIHLLHVYETDDPREAQARLTELAASSRRPPKLLLEPLQQRGVAEVILGVARREGADLLILGPHGGHGLSEGRLGQVTRHLLLCSHIPVHLVPETLEQASQRGRWGRVLTSEPSS